MKAQSSRLKLRKYAIASKYGQVTAAYICDGATAAKHHGLFELGEEDFDREINSLLAVILHALASVPDDRRVNSQQGPIARSCL
jgi:hypothetical protein